MKTENIIIQGKNYLRGTGIRNDFDFVIPMIKAVKPNCLLDFEVFEGNECDQVLYKTDSHIKLSEYLSKNGMDIALFRKIIESIQNAVKTCSLCLIDSKRLVLDSEIIYLRPDKFELKYTLSLFECPKQRQAIKRFFSNLLGNYYTGYGINDENFREWAAKEINKNDFTPGKMLASWEYRNDPGKDNRVYVQNEEKKESGFTLLKSILSNKLIQSEKSANETLPIRGISGETYLTGICSIDTKIPIADEGITIGRQMLKQDYGLFNSGIGKTHARVYKTDEGIFVTDMGSRNGTYLNGERLDKHKPNKLAKGDIVSFSDEEFILC